MAIVTRPHTLISLRQVCFQFANGNTLFDQLTIQFDATPTAIVRRNGVLLLLDQPDNRLGLESMLA